MKGETNILKQGNTQQRRIWKHTDCLRYKINTEICSPVSQHYGQSTNWIPQTGHKLVFSKVPRAAETTATYFRG